MDIGTRERKYTNLSVENMLKQQMHGEIKPAKPRQHKPANRPAMHDFQFYQTSRINELFDKEDQLKIQRTEFMDTKPKEEKKDDLTEDELAEKKAREEEEEARFALSSEELEERERLLSEGYSNWSKKDFQAFLKACERYGRKNVLEIAKEVEGKELEEVQRYSATFWANVPSLTDQERIIKKIEQGESKIARRDEIQRAVQKKFQKYSNPWMEMKIAYGPNKGKGFNEEEDRYLICLTHQLGYGRWDEMKWEIRKSWEFRFDWFIKSRLPTELNRRVDTLVRLIEKENEQEEIKEKESRKKKRSSDASERGGKAQRS